MALKKNGPGCSSGQPCAGCGACTTGAITLPVNGCGAVPLSGQAWTATLSGGPTAGTFTATAGVGGPASFTGLAAGTYTVTVTSHGYTTGSVTGVVVACGATTTPSTLTLAAVTALFICCGGRNGLLVPKTLYLTNIYGDTVTLVSTGGPWSGCVVSTRPNVVDKPGGVCTVGTFGMQIQYSLTCASVVTVFYNEYTGPIPGGLFLAGTCPPGTAAACSGTAQSKAAGALPFSTPFSASGTFATGPIAGAFTIVE